MRVFEYAPYSEILPRGALTVHHGGIGTTAQCLRSGRPMIVVPHIADQFDNAARAAALGVSRTIARPAVDRLTHAIAAVLASQSMAHAAMQTAAAIQMARRLDGLALRDGASEHGRDDGLLEDGESDLRLGGRPTAMTNTTTPPWTAKRTPETRDVEARLSSAGFAQVDAYR